MKIRVLLFARLREALQKEEVCLEVPQRTKALEVLPILFGSREGMDKTARTILFAINQTYVSSDAELKEGDELLLIPPVAGG